MANGKWQIACLACMRPCILSLRHPCNQKKSTVKSVDSYMCVKQVLGGGGGRGKKLEGGNTDEK